MSNIIATLEKERMQREVPDFGPGDTVVVEVKVKEGERERDGEVNHPPLLDHVEGQAVPVQPVIHLLDGQALIEHSLPRLREPAARALEEILAGQSAAHIDHHGRDGEPAEVAVNVLEQADHHGKNTP